MQVIGTTPLPGLGTALRDVPANVQIFGRRDFDRQRPLDLTDFLGANANSVGIGAAQGNAYQQDINFRGFTASPLLGAAQGLSAWVARYAQGRGTRPQYQQFERPAFAPPGAVFPVVWRGRR